MKGIQPFWHSYVMYQEIQITVIYISGHGKQKQCKKQSAGRQKGPMAVELTALRSQTAVFRSQMTAPGDKETLQRLKELMYRQHQQRGAADTVKDAEPDSLRGHDNQGYAGDQQSIEIEDNSTL